MYKFLTTKAEVQVETMKLKTNRLLNSAGKPAWAKCKMHQKYSGCSAWYIYTLMGVGFIPECLLMMMI